MNDQSSSLKRSERIALYLAVAIAVVVIAWVGWGTSHRVAELASGHDVPVAVPLTDTQADEFLGLHRTPGWTTDLNSITFPVEHPPAGMLIALWVDAIARFVAVAAGMIVAARFLLRVARGRGLEEGTARLVLAGAGILAASWLTHALTNAFAAPAAVSQLTGGYTLDRVAIDLSPVPWILFLAAAGVAFYMGEKLRSETEGLV